MKKYKLIKEYPGSDLVGTIITGNKETMYSKGLGYRNYDWAHVETHPEFFEEVVEKDYEIVSYVAKDCDFIIVKGSEYPSSLDGLPNDYWKILSVKRLSDGEVFTVGDKVKVYEYGSIKTITEIAVNDTKSLVKQGIWLRYDYGSSHMTHAIKVENPIFLTHDGKDIFDGDKVWCVNKHSQFIGIDGSFIATSTVHFNSDLIAYFLTMEDADSYIAKNRVLFTTEDGVDIKRGDTFYFVDTDLSIGLSNTKYEKCDGRKYFSTFETALYSMIVNAKVLSIEDFWEFVCWGGSNIAKSKRLKRLVKERLNLK